jgi:4-amino-4-deoxy-L-arabinose transferase-like glycosyltransferase
MRLTVQALKSRWDILLLIVIVCGFVFVAAQRLGAVPVPEGDEAFTLQVPYEMLNHGRLALPMLRYLGGNIENVWHSFTPVAFLLMSGFFKLFGFGLEQGRAFNLLTAATTLVMVYFISRRLFDWRAGLFAVLMMVGDQTFIERSRLLRNDYAAATFALLAFYLFEIARKRQSKGFTVASGLAAGAGVMCHTNILYIIIALGLLILMDDGWRAIKQSRLYLFGLSAFAVMAYEVIYDLIDYRNFALQNRGDDLHFRVLSPAGFLQNALEERLRYARWWAGSAMFDDFPTPATHVFQLLTVVAVIYLAFVFVRQWRRGPLTTDARVRVFVVLLVVVLFHAIIVSHKRIYYLAHLAPWFAIAVGILLGDAIARIRAWRTDRAPRAQLAYRLGTAFITVALIVYAGLLVRQATRFVREVRNPQLATFDELELALREIIPAGLCPVAVKNPSVWLAFPESDRCFATIENRMKEALDLDGNEYALVTRPNVTARGSERANSIEMADEKYHLLGEIRDTAYGTLLIYYTGRDPRILALASKRFQFNGLERGHTVLNEPER